MTKRPMSTNKGTVANTYSEIVPSAARESVRVAITTSRFMTASPINPTIRSEIAISMPSAINASTLV